MDKMTKQNLDMLIEVQNGNPRKWLKTLALRCVWESWAGTGTWTIFIAPAVFT